MARIVPSNIVPGSTAIRAGSVIPVRPVPPPARPGAPRPVPPPPVREPPPVYGVPILMHDQVIVGPGNEQPMGSKAFLNTRSKSVGIHALNLSTYMVLAAATARYALGGTIALQIALTKKNGKTIPLTRGYVPAWCLGRSDNRRADAFNGGTASTISGMQWRFPTPIVLDPRDGLTVQVKHTGVAAIPVTVDVVFIGSDAPVAGARRLPYAAHWQSRDFTYSEVGTDTTSNDALLNDTGTDLTVDRIIGRFAAFDNPGYAEFIDYTDLTDQEAHSASIRMGISQNRPIMRNYTSFRSAFGTEAAIETAFKMAPQDYITADVKHVAGAVLAVPLVYFRGRAFLSIVGSRGV